MSIVNTVAKAKVEGKSANEGDWILPDTRGQFVITQFENVGTGLSVNVLLVGKIISCEPSTTGGAAHSPGSYVKKLYQLSAKKWAASELKRDILNIVGEDATTTSEEDAENILTEIFENSESDKFGLKGTLVNFRSVASYKKGPDGKKTNEKNSQFPNIFFNYVEKGNSPKEIAARKKDL